MSRFGLWRRGARARDLLSWRLIDLELTSPMPVVFAWEKVKPIAEGLRKQLNLPELWGGFEYLYYEMQKREQRLQQTQQ